MSLRDLSGRLPWPLTARRTAAVVEQGVDGLLQHALFVAQDDAGGLDLDELLQPVVPVDDAAVEIVQVAGGEAAAVQGDQRTQVRRQHRQTIQDHPLGLVVAAQEGVDDLQTLEHGLLALHAGLGLDLGPKLLVQGLPCPGRPAELAHGLGAHVHGRIPSRDALPSAPTIPRR
jgi:hypothetical protein